MDSFLMIVIAVFVYMSAAFAIAVLKEDNSLADIAWGGGFILVALVTFFKGPGPAEARQVLATALVTIWGVRLAVHIFFRNRGKGEDPRYAKWRREWGSSFLLRSYFQVFMLQGAIMIVVAAPVACINLLPTRGLTFLDGLGLAVWLVGFFFESVGDLQLLLFKKDPTNASRVMKTGLWSFTRHPNYFGEATMWWGLFIVALSAPKGYLSIISPVLITFLLLRVSGIPMLEKKLVRSQPGYTDYMKHTSPFIPWFPSRF